MKWLEGESPVELAFDERNLLLPGVYDVSMETVREHFGKFQKSDRRPNLFAKLEAYIEAVKKAGCGSSVIVDGSFVMACIDEPVDIDLTLVLPPGWDVKASLKPYLYNLVSKRSAKRDYDFDLATVEAGSLGEKTWIEFYGRTNVKWREKFGWPADTRKGILRVLL